MDLIVSLAEKGNYALGAELVRLKLAEQSQIDSVRLAFDEHLMDGNIKRASILKILTWDMEGVEEKVILDYQIEEFNLGFCSLLSFQIEREALPEFALKECWATMSVPFDSLSGMFFVSTASYLSRDVRKHWEKRLTPNIVWFLSDLSSLTRTLENMENEDEKNLAGGAKSEDVPRDEEEPAEGNQEETEPAEKGEAVEGNREETEPIDEVSSESARESEEPSPVMPTTAGPKEGGFIVLARSQVILVDTLKELGGIDEMQADGLKERSGLSGSDVEKILTGHYNVEPVPMLLAKAKAYNLAPINLQRFNVTDQCFEYLEVEFCKILNILPLGEVGSYIAIATSDPLNPTLKSKIEGATRKPFYFLLALESELQVKYDTGEKTHINPTVGFSDVVEALGLEFDLDAEKIEEKDFESEESAPVILLANRIIEDAYFSGGSDIHIEPFEDDTRVRVRVDGICKVKLTLPKKTTAALISRIKVMANLDIAERRVSQDGRILRCFDSRDIR